MAGLLDRRLLVVTGKGGTGKTTVAAALALQAAAQGKRVMLAEINTGERLAQLFDREPVGHTETAVGDRLSLLSIDPIAAAHDFLRETVGSALHRVLFQNRLFTVTMAAAPGLREICTMDRLHDLQRTERARRRAVYDLVVVDAAATGHATAMLRSPTTFTALAKGGGPIRRRAEEIGELIRDRRRTAVVLTALPEETPVTETIETAGRIRDLQVQVGLVVADQVRATQLTNAQAERLETLVADHEIALSAENDPGAVAPVAAAAVSVQHRRARAEAQQLRRLRDGLGETVPVAPLPRLDGPLGREQLRELGRRLGEELA